VRGLLVLWLAAAQAQPLDLRLVPVTEGVIASIREVNLRPERVPPPMATGQVGAPSDIEDRPPVGAVLYRPVGPASGDKAWKFGAAGTPEMQATLAQTGYEVEVSMQDGERRVFRMPDAARFRIGQRVTLRSGQLEPLPRDGT